MVKIAMTTAVALVLAVQPTAGQYGLKAHQITSYWHYSHPLAHVSMYSTYASGATTFYYFFQNRENVGVPHDLAGWYCIYAPQIPCTPGPTGYPEIPYQLNGIFETGLWLLNDILDYGYDTFGSVNVVDHTVDPNKLGPHMDMGPVDTDGLIGMLDYYPYNAAFFGCTVPSDIHPEVGYWQTCPDQGLDGAVGLWFSVAGRRDLTDVYTPSGDIHTTPEPITLLLMGSGLVGVAAARRQRKRRNESFLAN